MVKVTSARSPPSSSARSARILFASLSMTVYSHAMQEPPKPPPVQRQQERIVYVERPAKRGFFDGAGNCLAGIILIFLFLMAASCLWPLLFGGN